jgi:hypothetical protein
LQALDLIVLLLGDVAKILRIFGAICVWGRIAWGTIHDHRETKFARGERGEYGQRAHATGPNSPSSHPGKGLAHNGHPYRRPDGAFGARCLRASMVEETGLLEAAAWR